LEIPSVLVLQADAAQPYSLPKPLAKRDKLTNQNTDPLPDTHRTHPTTPIYNKDPTNKLAGGFNDNVAIEGQRHLNRL